jgi:hypothetical protein
MPGASERDDDSRPGLARRSRQTSNGGKHELAPVLSAHPSTHEQRDQDDDGNRNAKKKQQQ